MSHSFDFEHLNFFSDGNFSIPQELVSIFLGNAKMYDVIHLQVAYFNKDQEKGIFIPGSLDPLTSEQ